MLREKILIVDDDSDILDVLKITLEAEGYEVLEGHNGQEALALGVHSIIIDPLGKEMFSEYVNEKQFSYVESGKDLIQLIKRGRDKSYIEQESPHIDTSKETVIQAIETIING